MVLKNSKRIKTLTILLTSFLVMTLVENEEADVDQELKLLHSKLDIKIPCLQIEEDDDVRKNETKKLFSTEIEMVIPECLRKKEMPVQKSSEKKQMVPVKVETPPPSPEPQTPLGRYGEGNTYVPGQCTWYVKDFFKKRVGDYWGNAITWGERAAADGLLVDNNPVVDSTVAVFGSDAYNMGYGHVAVVIGVREGFVRIREMNCPTPWSMNDRDVPISGIMCFIHV